MEMAGMNEGKTFDELMRDHWKESRKKGLRRIIYLIGDVLQEGYVEIDDINERFIPIRNNELCEPEIKYVNSECIREYRLEPLCDKEQEHWEITVDYEAEFRGAM